MLERVRLNQFGRGSIGPGPRIERGEISQRETEDFIGRLETGEFYDHTDNFMPKCCVDGRPRADGLCEPGANAAGGVFSLVAADLLTAQSFRGDAQDTAVYAGNVLKHLQRTHRGEFGDHDAVQTAAVSDCGCGAIDKMAPALELIASHGDDLLRVAAAVGISIARNDYEAVVIRAQQIINDHDIKIASGAAMLDALKKIAGADSCETLTGEHAEVVVVVNEREFTTLNRAKIITAIGGGLQAFNYDRWAMRKAVRAICRGLPGNGPERALAAADLYNLSVTCTLAGPSLYALRRAP